MYCKILQSLEISDLVLIIKLVSDTHVHLLQRWGFQTKWINILTQKFIRSFFIIIPLRSKLVIQTFNGLVRCLNYCRSRFLNWIPRSLVWFLLLLWRVRWWHAFLHYHKSELKLCWNKWFVYKKKNMYRNSLQYWIASSFQPQEWEAILMP